MWRIRHASFVLILWADGGLIADDGKASQPSPPAVTIKADDVRGKPEQDLVKVENARYFVWHDSNGWHLRTASRALMNFTGSIKIDGGTFGKLRPIGLEAKARNPDRWEVNKDRTEIRFAIYTVGSFDGFDFDIPGGKDPDRIAFDLKLGRGNKRWPKRIFLGRDNKQPTQGHFECSAHPDQPQKASPEPK